MNTDTRWPPKELMDKIRLQGVSTEAPESRPPVVSLADFFNGNDSYGSFAANLTVPLPPPPPGCWNKLRAWWRGKTFDLPAPSDFYQLFKRVRDRDEVQDVLVEIRELEEEADGRQWPYSDTVLILARASRDEVAGWLEGPLHPDDLSEGYPNGKPRVVRELADGVKVFAAWWD
jgi:hypothetical protein